MGNIEENCEEGRGESISMYVKPYAQEFMHYTPGYCDNYIVWSSATHISHMSLDLPLPHCELN